MTILSTEVFQLFAWYNRKANAAMSEILARNERIAAQAETTYYGSILGLLSHVYLSDITWLRRLWDEAREVPEPLQRHSHGLGDSIFETVDAWDGARVKLDQVIETFARSLSAPDLASDFTYQNSKGTEFSHPRWQAVLHMFNHQTHHRGQVAQVLDQEGVPNDFSNIIWYVREGE